MLGCLNWNEAEQNTPAATSGGPQVSFNQLFLLRQQALQSALPASFALDVLALLQALEPERIAERSNILDVSFELTNSSILPVSSSPSLLEQLRQQVELQQRIRRTRLSLALQNPLNMAMTLPQTFQYSPLSHNGTRTLHTTLSYRSNHLSCGSISPTSENNAGSGPLQAHLYSEPVRQTVKSNWSERSRRKRKPSETTSSSLLNAQNSDDQQQTRIDSEKESSGGESPTRIVRRRRYRGDPFPIKLRRMIETAEETGLGHLISFTKDGQAVRLSSIYDLEDLLFPKYFVSLKRLSKD